MGDCLSLYDQQYPLEESLFGWERTCSRQLQYHPQQTGQNVQCPACHRMMTLTGATQPIVSNPSTSPVNTASTVRQPEAAAKTKTQIVLWSSVGGGVIIVIVALLIIMSNSRDPNKTAKGQAANPEQSAPMIENSIGMKFKPLVGGKLPKPMRSESNFVKTEIRQVDSYEIGVHEVTQEQYERVMGTNPGVFKNPKTPVHGVTWRDANEFCQRLSELDAEKATGYVYRLPTSAEWEYACRANTETRFSFGDEPSQLGDHDWYQENSHRKPHPVGQKKPNPWGLYDMHGNVSEWCHDRLSTGHVERGGCWKAHFRYSYSSREGFQGTSYRADDLGFRVVRTKED